MLASRRVPEEARNTGCSVSSELTGEGDSGHRQHVQHNLKLARVYVSKSKGVHHG
jgi:hypothetical protein